MPERAEHGCEHKLVGDDDHPAPGQRRGCDSPERGETTSLHLVHRLATGEPKRVGCGVPCRQQRAKPFAELRFVQPIELPLVHLHEVVVEVEVQAQLRRDGEGGFAGSKEGAGPHGADRTQGVRERGRLVPPPLIQWNVGSAQDFALDIPGRLAVADDEEGRGSRHGAADAISDGIPRVAHELQQERL